MNKPSSILKALPAFLAVGLALSPLRTRATEPSLVAHEWGTFTSLQDEAGQPIGGINTDDEPVPQFVRRLAYDFLLSPSEAPPSFFQGAPRCHPDVTMRLETPVLYFYPPAGGTTQPFDVHVAFHGGWLTEFYPAAEVRAPGFDLADPNGVYPIQPLGGPNRSFPKGFGHLRPDADGELEWSGVKLGVSGQGPGTDEKVWLAPRAVPSAMLQTAFGEKEKFLFYRGVGNARAALSIVRDENLRTLEIRDAQAGSPAIRAAWLVEIAPDGRCVFRSLGALPADAHPRATLPIAFPPEDFPGSHLAQLQAEMRAALIQAGLFAKEADALLHTWEISYFKSPGLRLFYLCNPAEVEQLLPLQISVPCQLTRVMIGRIEIVTPGQRALLAKIAAGPAIELWKMRGVTGDSRSDFFKDPENMRRWNAVMEGKAPYRDLGLPIPEIYATYLQLGRFRNALLLDEEKRRPTPALHDYINKNLFDGYQVGSPPQ